MRSIRFTILSIAMVSLFSCTSPQNVERQRQELMEADQAFSRLSSEQGMNQAFETYCAKDGVILSPGSMPIAGKEAVTELLGKRDDSVFELTWEPLYAKVARSGELGYTYGIFTRRLESSGEVMQGTYVSVWIKEDGAWRFVLDSGNEGLGE